MTHSSLSASPVQSNTGGTKTIVIIIIVLAVIALGYLLARNNKGVNSGKRSGAENGASSSEVNKNNGGIEKPAGPSEIFSYTGEVTAVGDRQISILAKAGVNFLDKDTELTVKADEFTEITRMTIPATRPRDDDPNPFKKEKIKLSDIKKGERVTVISNDNIKGKTEFAASRIEVQVTK